MRAELRPSSLGEILDRTAQMYRGHFLLYFGIAAVSYSGILVLSLIANVLFLSRAHTNPRAYAGLSVGIGVVIVLLTILPVAVGMAAVMHAVARNYLGQPSTIREAYVSVGRRWYRYILILLAMDFYAALPIIVLVAVMAAAATILPAGLTRGIVVGLTVILMLAAMVFVVWWLLRWALSVPASVMENLTVHRALKRSRVLTRGSVGRIFVMLLLVGVIMMLIQYAVQIPMFFLLWKSKGVPTLTTQVVASIGSSFSGAFVLPIYSIALTLFYYDQRIRKEGYDVEWLMEQAGMTSTPIPPAASMLPPAAPGPLTAQTEPQLEPPGPAI